MELKTVTANSVHSTEIYKRRREDLVKGTFQSLGRQGALRTFAHRVWLPKFDQKVSDAGAKISLKVFSKYPNGREHVENLLRMGDETLIQFGSFFKIGDLKKSEFTSLCFPDHQSFYSPILIAGEKNPYAYQIAKDGRSRRLVHLSATNGNLEAQWNLNDVEGKIHHIQETKPGEFVIASLVDGQYAWDSPQKPEWKIYHYDTNDNKLKLEQTLEAKYIKAGRGIVNPITLKLPLECKFVSFGCDTILLPAENSMDGTFSCRPEGFQLQTLKGKAINFGSNGEMPKREIAKICFDKDNGDLYCLTTLNSVLHFKASSPGEYQLKKESGLEVFDNEAIDASLLPDLIDLREVNQSTYEKLDCDLVTKQEVKPYQLPQQSEHIPNIPIMYFQGHDDSCGFNSYFNILAQLGLELDQNAIEAVYQQRRIIKPSGSGLANIGMGIDVENENAILKMLSENIVSRDINLKKISSLSDTTSLENNAMALQLLSMR